MRKTRSDKKADSKPARPRRAAAGKVVRDVRVDVIGAIEALAAHFGKKLKKTVKDAMAARGLERVVGDAFTGLLVVPAAGRVVPPGKLLALYEKKQISRSELLSVLSVKIQPLKEIVGEQQIDAMAEPGEPATATLTIERKKDDEISLADAVAAIAKAVAADGGGKF